MTSPRRTIESTPDLASATRKDVEGPHFPDIPSPKTASEDPDRKSAGLFSGWGTAPPERGTLLRALAVLLLAIFSRNSFALDNPPTDTRNAPQSNQKFFKDVSYNGADDQACRCDIRLPSSDRLANRAGQYPVALIVHGGAWTTGDKWTMAAWSLPLSERGFACVTINYRLAPRFRFPAQVDDVRSALAWLPSVQDRYKLDLDRIGLVGYSAGAHLATLTATSANSLGERFEATSLFSVSEYEKLRVPKIRAVVGGGTPTRFTDIPPNSELLSYWFGGTPKELPEAYKYASPIEHVDRKDPPILLVHGVADSLVSLSQAEALLAKSQTAGVPTRLVTNVHGGHMATFVSQTMKSEMVSFLERHLSPKKPADAPEDGQGN